MTKHRNNAKTPSKTAFYGTRIKFYIFGTLLANKKSDI